MATDTFNFFNNFSDYLGEKVIDFNNDTLKFMLTNTAPVVTNSLYGDISGNEIANGGGYTTGGETLTTVVWSETSGAAKLESADVVWTGTAGGMATFRYAVLYDDTPVSPAKPLIGWIDYTEALDVADTETFTIAETGGYFTISFTNP